MTSRIRIQSSQPVGPLNELRAKFLVHWVPVTLSALMVAGFLLRALPLLQYPRVGGDPLVHYEYSMALLNGKLSLPVPAGNTGIMVELYYPPLFHLLSLAFFLALPRIDPYSIMKVLASALDALQIVPIYLIVKRVSGSSFGGVLASYVLLTTRNDYQMLAWGGYANIAGLLLATSLVYAVMIDRLALSAILSAVLGLTHHLSALFMVAVLTPYFALFLWRKKQIPKSLIGVIIGGAVAYVTFYQFAWPSIYYYYSRFVPVYEQGLYVTPYILELVGPLLLLSAALGFTLAYKHVGQNLIKSKEILVVWAIVPFLLSYAYLIGVQWHGVRWIAFIQQPLAVWAGMGLGYLGQKKIMLIVLALLFTIQLFLTIQGYHFDILNNLSQ